MPISSRITSTAAFAEYRDMGDKRSIKGLFDLLKDKGVRISRKTLMAWHKDEAWAEQLQDKPGLVAKARAETAIIKHVAKELTALTDSEKVESTLETLAALTKGLAHVCLIQIQAHARETPMSVEEILNVAKVSGEVAKAIAVVATAMKQAAPSAPAPDVLPPVNAGPVFPGLAGALASLRNPPREQ